MLRTAIREYVIQPMAVQMRPARATAPVHPNRLVLVVAIAMRSSVEMMPSSPTRPGREAVQEGDERVERLLVAGQPDARDREHDVDGGEDREERLVAHARGEDEPVAGEEVPPHAHGEEGHGLLREGRDLGDRLLEPVADRLAERVEPLAGARLERRGGSVDDAGGVRCRMPRGRDPSREARRSPGVVRSLTGSD